MAKTLVVVLTCDRCSAEGADGSEVSESVNLAFDGYSYSLDLCSAHADVFHNTVQEMIGWSNERSRLGGQRRGRRMASGEAASESPAPTRTSGDRERLKSIRDWARKHGHPDLSDRGRIPQIVVSEYEAAQKG